MALQNFSSLSTLPFTSILIDDGIVHIVIVIMAGLILLVSVLAYLRRRNARYLFLTLAFMFLFISQLITSIEVLFLSDYLLIIPQMGLHLSHVFDLLTLISFGVALTRDSGSQTQRHLNHRSGVDRYERV